MAQVCSSGMLRNTSLTLCESNCSAPPLLSSFRPPCLSREAEAVLRPRAPLRPTKREVRESEASLAEFVLDDADVKVKVEAPVEIAQDPRQLYIRLAAVRIEQPAPTASSSSEEIAGPSGRPTGRKPYAGSCPANWAPRTSLEDVAAQKGPSRGHACLSLSTVPEDDLV